MPALNFKGGVVQCHESGSHVGRWLISRALARRLDGSAACSTAPTIRLLAHEVKGQKNTPGGSRPPGGWAKTTLPSRGESSRHAVSLRQRRVNCQARVCADTIRPAPFRSRRLRRGRPVPGRRWSSPRSRSNTAWRSPPAGRLPPAARTPPG